MIRASIPWPLASLLERLSQVTVAGRTGHKEILEIERLLVEANRLWERAIAVGDICLGCAEDAIGQHDDEICPYLRKHGRRN